MAITRRVFVSGAMAAPLAAQLAGAGSAAAAEQVGGLTLTVLDGLAELQLTDLALKQLATQGIQVQAVAPATAIIDSDGTTVRGVKLTPEYATTTVTLTGQPSAGGGRLHGGVVLVNSKARMEITEIRCSMPDGQIFAFMKVNDEWLGELPVYVSDPSAMRLSVQLGTPGVPVAVGGSGIPITPTQKGADAFTAAFGVPLFTTEDTVFTAAGHGTAWPLPSLPV